MVARSSAFSRVRRVPLQQDLRPFLAGPRGPPPLAVPAGLYCPADLGNAKIGHGGDNVTAGWVGDIEHGTVVGVNPLSADIGLHRKKRWILQQ